MGNAEYALNTYWGIPDAELEWRLAHLSQWKNMLKENLYYAMPIIYAGNKHAWVIDGYDEDDNFHCNWGWGSVYPTGIQGWGNGFYSLGGFTPTIDGTEYDWSNFLNEMAIFNIDPAPFSISNISGPSTLTSSAVTFTINKANCVNANWTHSNNIYNYYGGGANWNAFTAIGSGTGWIQATYTIYGITYASPKKYVTCIP